jgi:hypothetical protein
MRPRGWDTATNTARWLRRERLLRHVQWTCIVLAAVCAVILIMESKPGNKWNLCRTTGMLCPNGPGETIVSKQPQQGPAPDAGAVPLGRRQPRPRPGN